MGRTQAAVVAGVGDCLAAHGVRRTTMIDIAAAAGIAKATLYNHVRTKAEALALYADEQVAAVVAQLDGDPGPALLRAAEAVAAHPVVRSLAAAEPVSLTAALIGPPAALRHARVREALEDLLGVEVAPLAVRWLGSLLADPGEAPERAATAQLLADLGQAFRADPVE